MCESQRIALVSGANRGLGQEMCRQLAKADILPLLSARRLEDAEAAAEVLRGEGLKVRAIQLDVTKSEDIERVATKNGVKYMERRDFIAGVAALSAAGMAVRPGFGQAKINQPSPEEALKRLLVGNRNYASGKRLIFQLNQGRLAELHKGQHPFATIIGCADSRVPVELVFDQDPGALFVIRLAGNVVDEDVQGSLEYAAVHLATPLIVVMGHENCGAVTAALAAQKDQSKELRGVRQLLKKVQPAIKHIDRHLPMDQQVALGVEANVRWSMKQIIEHPDHSEAIKTGDVIVVGAVYELRTGKVRFLKNSM